MRNQLHKPLTTHPSAAGWIAPERFTRDGSDALEEQLNQTCHDVLDAVRQEVPASRLEAILLGGGYGRGEGGVLKTAAGDEPYNDLEFYVAVRGNRFLNRRRYQRRLHEQAARFTTALGIEVEFQILSLQSLRRAQMSMFYYDLICGHRWVWGNEAMLAGCDHFRCAATIPAAEATRLLMNRCTGLLLAEEKLRATAWSPADADFVGRNLAKIQLALGDAVLTRFGEYHWSCLERQRRLEQWVARHHFAWGASVARHHAAGVEFKLHPHRAESSAHELRARHTELTSLAREVWLWLEQWRLGRCFTAIEDYALDNANKCPDTNAWRNGLLNLAAFNSPLRFWNKAGRHPRERLFAGLALLLWGRDNTAPPISRFLQRCLGARTADRPALLEAYLALWRRFR